MDNYIHLVDVAAAEIELRSTYGAEWQRADRSAAANDDGAPGDV